MAITLIAGITAISYPGTLVNLTNQVTGILPIANGGTGSTAGAWLLNGNTVVSEKFIGTIDNFDFPIRANNIEIIRAATDGVLRFPASSTSGRGNLQFNGAASASYFANTIYIGDSTQSMGMVFGGSPTYTTATGPWILGRGNTYSASGGFRGTLLLAAGNPSAPGATEGGIGFVTGAGILAMFQNNAGNLGLGTTSQTTYSGYTTLAINNVTNGGLIDFMTAGNVYGQINNSTSTFNILALNGAKINWGTGGVIASTVDAAHNVINIFGTADQSFSYQTPTAGFTITIAAGVKTLLLDPAGTLLNGTVTMPAAPINGQEIRMSSTKAITTLTVQGNSGQSMADAPTTIALGDGYGFIYRTTNTTWYRIY